ncbi:hypothetical protein [Candidatus Cloacimonas acidaminovorans]|uniref:hypothetical protein n=1 Tax=Candidatus Cloacimonas acidaminovorans TaxID=456827 RepID=UPI0005C730BC|nr:hypothetical protein [Candidatus Cloacimonas acidaminovorans]HQF90431.1 hypothetical protein [Methanofastidiosum sp.]
MKNNAGYWSLNEYKFIYLSSYAQPAINSVCWYFSDSGANPDEVYTYAITNPAKDITVALDASIVHLQQDGEYQLVLYTINARGQKSMPEYKFFTADFSPNNVVLSINGTNLTLTSFIQIHYFPNINSIFRMGEGWEDDEWMISYSQV